MRHKLLLFFVMLIGYIPYIVFGVLVYLGYITVWEFHWFDFDWFGSTVSVELNIIYVPHLASTAIGLIGGFVVWCFVEPCDEPPIPVVIEAEGDLFQIDLSE